MRDTGEYQLGRGGSLDLNDLGAPLPLYQARDLFVAMNRKVHSKPQLSQATVPFPLLVPQRSSEVLLILSPRCLVVT